MHADKKNNGDCFLSRWAALPISDVFGLGERERRRLRLVMRATRRNRESKEGTPAPGRSLRAIGQLDGVRLLGPGTSVPVGHCGYSIVKELTSRIGLLLIAPGCAPDFLPVFVLGERLGGCRGLGVH